LLKSFNKLLDLYQNREKHWWGQKLDTHFKNFLSKALKRENAIEGQSIVIKEGKGGQNISPLKFININLLAM